MSFTLQDYSYSGTRDLLGVCMDRCGDSVTPEGQANPKGSRERRVELWELARGTRRAEGYQRERRSKVTNRERE